MKKLLMTIAVIGTAFLSSCSKDDSSPQDNSVVTARIDGVDYTFDTFVVDQETYTNDEGVTYTDVEVTASINADPSRVVSFIVTEGELGTEASWYFAYFLNDTAYPKIPEEFLTQVTLSTDNHVMGTFSGQVRSIGEPIDEILTIENGRFEIYY